MRLTKFFSERTKTKIKYILSNGKNEKYSSLSKDEPKVFVFLAGLYQNLGDMAITYSQKKFLQDLYPNSKVVLVPSTETYDSIKTIKKVITDKDLITIIGGGNMDDMYPSLEYARTFVVKSFPKNKIVSFPQTVIFRDTSKGKKLLKRSAKIYSKHKNLTICVREEESLVRAQKYFPKVKIVCCPDVVLSLNETQPKMQRQNVLCCLRKDKEQRISSQAREDIISEFKNKFNNVIIKDTVDVDLKDCLIHTYENTLKGFWEMLRSCKIVVTDRLHCVIFCVITNTPCIAIDNSNKKISGTFNKWLKNVNFVKMIPEFNKEQIIDCAREILEDSLDVREISLKKEFEPLVEACK